MRVPRWMTSALTFSLYAAAPLAVVLVCAGCDGGSGESCDRVSGEEARGLIAEEGATLLDVRSREEYEQGHIDGATLIPHTEIEERLDEVPKSKPVVVYCRSGNRSAVAAGKLRKHGYRVYDLGGINAWDTTGVACER